MKKKKKKGLNFRGGGNLNFRNFLFEFKMIVAVDIVGTCVLNLIFDIYDLISKRSYCLLMRVFLNHIKVQFKKKILAIYSMDKLKNKCYLYAPTKAPGSFFVYIGN